VFPVAVNAVTVVVASDEVPVTESVPEDVIDEVAVILPPVRELMNDVVEVAFVVTSDVMFASVAIREEKKPLVLVLLVMVPFVA
jgi:aspartokinase-like uncharacterized kinase